MRIKHIKTSSAGAQPIFLKSFRFFWGNDCSRIACHSASKFRSLYTDFRKYTFPWTNR